MKSRPGGRWTASAPCLTDHSLMSQPSPPLECQLHEGITFPVVPLALRRAPGRSLNIHQVNGLRGKDI